MTLPRQIPEHLQAAGIPLEPDAASEMGWCREDACNVILSLSGTKVAVVACDVYVAESWGLVSTNDNLSLEHLVSETATEFAERSRRTALAYIDAHEETTRADTFYALSFSRQQDAA